MDPAYGIPQARVRNPEHKIVILEWDRCVAGPPCGKAGLFPPGVESLCFWSVCRVHFDQSNVLFADWHVEGMEPGKHHSRVDSADETTGYPIVDGTAYGPADPIWAGAGPEWVVDEDTWRHYWDVDSRK